MLIVTGSIRARADTIERVLALSLVGWAVGGVVVAVRGFRWEPRATAA